MTLARVGGNPARSAGAAAREFRLAVTVTDRVSWHEHMRGRACALLISVEGRLPTDTAALAHEMIDHNEYGVAVDMSGGSGRAVRGQLTSAGGR